MTKGRSETDIPKAPARRILEKAGARRVSEGSVEAFVDVLEELTARIGKKAVEIAELSGRKTVKQRDIKLAAKQEIGHYF